MLTPEAYITERLNAIYKSDDHLLSIEFLKPHGQSALNDQVNRYKRMINDYEEILRFSAMKLGENNDPELVTAINDVLVTLNRGLDRLNPS